MDYWGYLSTTQWSMWSVGIPAICKAVSDVIWHGPAGLINVTVHSTDGMILPVLSEVLKFVLSWGSQYCALAAVRLPFHGFKTRYGISLSFSWWCGSGKPVVLLFLQFPWQQRSWLPLSLEVLHTGLVSFSGRLPRWQVLFYHASTVPQHPDARASFMYCPGKTQQYLTESWNKWCRSLVMRVVWSTRALESIGAWLEVPDFFW